MNDLFHPYLRKFVLVFFDDILVYSKNWSLHLKHVETILKLLEENKFYANKSKCSFGQEEIEFLGHVVSTEGIKVDPKKIMAITEWPSPKMITSLRGFLGLTGYYRRFVKNYANIVAPLTTLLKKDAFRWNNAAEDCFKKMKTLMTSTPILAAPNFTNSFFLECDASGIGIGVVLMQDNHPIAFESRRLKPKEHTKSTYDKEMLAIIHALVKWKQYLLGAKFLVKTDHNSLKYFLNQKSLSVEQQKWVSKIQVFDFEILYKKGKENLVVDGLSRKDEGDATLCAISVVTLEWISDVQVDYMKNMWR
jgi:hypothetical protein